LEQCTSTQFIQFDLSVRISLPKNDHHCNPSIQGLF
jgi:hypothetical protein